MTTLIGTTASGKTVQFEAPAEEIGIPGISGTGPQQFRVTSLMLTSAQILASFTTPIQIVQGQAGKTILPVAAQLLYNRGTADYTGADDIGLYYFTPAGALDGAEIIDFGNWAALVTSSLLLTRTPVTAALNPSASTLGQGDSLALATATANPAAGNGTVTIKVAYLLV